MMILGTLISLGSSAGFAKNITYLYAAASTQNVVEAVLKSYNTKSETRFLPVYGATSALARQILDGAPASLFLAANKAWMDRITESNLVRKSKNVFFNRLVLVAPHRSSLKLTKNKLSNVHLHLNGGRLAVAEVSAVPAGIYAKQALKNLQIWPKIKNKLAQSTNVRAALALVERDEVPLGIVYHTDSLASPYVKTLLEIPENTHEKIAYPLALLNNKGQPNEALQLFKFFFSQQSRYIFHKYGFRTD